MTKGTTYPAEILTTEEIRQLLACCTSQSIGLRNKALIMVLWRCGLRISELLALRACDISADSVRVLHGKGDKARTVGVDSETAAVVALWLERRKSLGLSGRQPLFCDLKGGALHTNAVRELLKRLAAKAGIVKRVHPHGFRHTFAAHAAKQLPIHYVQQALGHSSLDVTSRYVNHLGSEAVVAVAGLNWG
jgi:site-specific recombinase XerD